MFSDAPLWQYLALLAVHWFGDFVLQTHWQASNKSTNNNALARHVGTYTLVLFLLSNVIFRDAPTLVVVVFALVNGALHFATDYFTSRWTSALYAKQDWHNFFVTIGFDQLIHQATLALTMVALLLFVAGGQL